MIVAHKIALDPNNVQKTQLARTAGVARFAFNWALTEWKRQYEAHKADPSLPKPSQPALRRQLNSIKREKFPWMLEVTKCAPQMAIIQLGAAFENFFAGRAGYPRFRKKGVHDRFSLPNSDFRIVGSRIRIPKVGWVRMREELRFKGKIVSATVSRTADRWFVSITVDIPDGSYPPKTEGHGVVGVDLGLSALATLSNGEVVAGRRPYREFLKRLRHLSRSLSRKVEGSKNQKKARIKLEKLRAHIAAIRADVLHKLTTDLTRRFNTIVIEDLSVRSMIAKNRFLARSIMDRGLFEFRRQLRYKAAWRGRDVIVASRWFPSSKTCSNCGHVLEVLPLSMRRWECPACGTFHDRDANAAINLMNLAVSHTASARGGGGSPASGEAGSGQPACQKRGRHKCRKAV